MPSAFHDDTKNGIATSRTSDLYALKALELRSRVFEWIERAQTPTSAFTSLWQWYLHARSVWQTLEMCGTDILQFRTMRQVLMAQELTEKSAQLLQKHVEEAMASRGAELVTLNLEQLKELPATDRRGLQMIDEQFASALEALKEEITTQLLEEFDDFIKKNEEKFYDGDVNREKRFSLVTPVRRKFAAFLQRWRGETARVQEMHTIETVFAEVSAKVDTCLAEMGDSVDVSNVESWFNAQWDEVLGDVTGRHKVSRMKIAEETTWTLNHALQRIKSQFRESRCVHKLKALSVQDAVRI
jgi:hypothetical protein